MSKSREAFAEELYRIAYPHASGGDWFHAAPAEREVWLRIADVMARALHSAQQRPRCEPTDTLILVASGIAGGLVARYGTGAPEEREQLAAHAIDIACHIVAKANALDLEAAPGQHQEP